MQPTALPLFRKSYSSGVALLTTSTLLSATFFGCTSQTTAKPDGDLGARSKIVTDYLGQTGDQAYQVEAPAATLQQHGIATYDVKIVDKAIHVGSLDQTGTQIASLELTPTDAGLRFTTREGAEQHVYVLRATGSVTSKDFNLRLTYDGKEFTVGYNARGQIVTTGDMAFAPPARSPLMKQMWRDVIPDGQGDAVVSEQAMSQCFACFLCGAGSVLLAAAVAGVIWLGWAVLAPIITIAFTQGAAAAIAALQAAGVAVGIATACITAVLGLGWGVVKACYKCITGNDLLTGEDTCTPEDDPEVGLDPEIGADGCSCPIVVETTPEMAAALVPAFQ